jgi:hypothetical protein
MLPCPAESSEATTVLQETAQDPQEDGTCSYDSERSVSTILGSERR